MSRSRELAELGTVYDGGSSLGFRNRIINGDCRIDQRNAGASVTPANNQYIVDRWKLISTQAAKLTAQRNAGSVTPPTGFANYLGFTSSSAYSVLTSDYFGCNQPIEGFNFSDLGWGTASAQTITLSFWVRSSLTGTFGGALYNSASNRSYPFSYSIPSANTWTNISLVVPGDTTGTWAADNSQGVYVNFSLGSGASLSGAAGAWAGTGYTSATGAVSVVGTSGATFYITGVQLEAGSVASPFERRDYGRELMMCQRYLPVIVGTGSGDVGMGITTSTSGGLVQYQFKVTPRVSPTGLVTAGSGVFALTTQAAASNVTAIAFSNASNDISRISVTGTGTPYATGAPCFLYGGAGATIQFTGCEL